MIASSRIAVVFVAVCLSGCGGLSMFGADTTASVGGWGKPVDGTRSSEAPQPPVSEVRANAAAPSIAASGQPGALPPQAHLTAKLPEPAPPLIRVAANSDVAANPIPGADPLTMEPRGRAYLFRGVAGIIFSRGLDKLADRIKHAGISASVDTYLVWHSYLDDAIRDYRRDPAPIILIGHSAGGDAVMRFASALNAVHIPVSLLVTYDPTHIALDVPPNTERYINLYQSSSLMGGGDLVPTHGFHGHYASVDLSEHFEIVHINIEKADRVHEQLVEKIMQLAATPAASKGEAVPIHYVVPADAPIELWDSGIPLTVKPGDTLQTLSVTYQVPVWALAQINKISERATLSPGQHIVMPRHLVPLAAPAIAGAAAYAPLPR